VSVDDPFLLLGLPTGCDDDARIRAAYHDLVRSGRADARVNAAYAAIRHAADRRRWRWCEPHSLVGPLPPESSGRDGPPQVAELIRELASLSDWELGRDA